MKYTKLERNFIFYDVGNSAYILIATTIIPIFFNLLAKEDLAPATYLAYWGYAVTFSTLVTAILGPILGAYADIHGKRKTFFGLFFLLGFLGCLLQPLPTTWLAFLILYILSKVGFNGSLIFYDSMMKDITSDDRMDLVSSAGYAWGYVGSCLPFILCLGLLLFHEIIGLTIRPTSILIFALIALWWLAFTLPLLKSYRQGPREENSLARQSLVESLKAIKKDKRLFFFLLSFLFYIDGVYTIINMATAYGSSLGLDQNGLILALLMTQFVAFPCAIFFGRLSKKVDSAKLLMVTILAYTCIAIFAVFLKTLTHFWILAALVGMFQGAIQALSRSYFAKLIPQEKSSQYFGIYDIFGKGASMFGTFVVSLISQITGNQNKALLVLVVFFILGLVFFYKSAFHKEKTVS